MGRAASPPPPLSSKSELERRASVLGSASGAILGRSIGMTIAARRGGRADRKLAGSEVAWADSRIESRPLRGAKTAGRGRNSEVFAHSRKPLRHTDDAWWRAASMRGGWKRLGAVGEGWGRAVEGKSSEQGSRPSSRSLLSN